MKIVDPKKVPTEILAEALLAIREKRSQRQLAQLELLYRAPCHQFPVDEFGQQSDFVKMFGKIGGALSAHMNLSPGEYQLYWIAHQVLVENGPRSWKMNANMVVALDTLGWFPKPAEPVEMYPTLASFHEGLTQAVVRSLAGSRAERLERLAVANAMPVPVTTTTMTYPRNADVIAEALYRSQGICESCRCKAPFSRNSDGSPYLEVHHILPLAEHGKDHVDNAIAVCPNCHRERHYGQRRFPNSWPKVEHIKDDALTAAVIPGLNATIDELMSFALSFDGDPYLVSPKKQSEARESLEDLRASLYLSQRSHRHGGADLDFHTYQEWQALVGQIRAKFNVI